ncbi:MAG: type II toxin-antitoxin system VapC family toxin [Chloroflexi bacterium]|nr:type II toxin-antitoxin system VapC family toxin [Chloroflexota bacterium]
MKYLMDTNTCIAFFRGRSKAIKSRLADVSFASVVLCAVVKAELYHGMERSKQRERNKATLDEFFANFVSLPFDDRAAEEYGRIRARLEKKGTPIGPYDLMIAAIALSNGLTLVTHNTGEFSRIEGLHLEDWESS